MCVTQKLASISVDFFSNAFYVVNLVCQLEIESWCECEVLVMHLHEWLSPLLGKKSVSCCRQLRVISVWSVCALLWKSVKSLTPFSRM